MATIFPRAGIERNERLVVIIRFVKSILRATILAFLSLIGTNVVDFAENFTGDSFRKSSFRVTDALSNEVEPPSNNSFFFLPLLLPFLPLVSCSRKYDIGVVTKAACHV